jgi:hypothetical protein
MRRAEASSASSARPQMRGIPRAPAPEGADGSLDLAAGEVRVFEPRGMPMGVRFLPCGTRIAVLTHGPVQVFDARTAGLVQSVSRSGTPSSAPSPVVSVGTCVVAGSAPGGWELVAAGAEGPGDFAVPDRALAYLSAEPAGMSDVAAPYSRPAAVALSPDGGMLAAVFGQAWLLLWDVRSRRLIRLIGDERPARNPPRLFRVAFSPGGDKLLTRDDAHRIRVWSVADGRRIGEVALGPQPHAAGARRPGTRWDRAGVGPAVFGNDDARIHAADGLVIRTVDWRRGYDVNAWHGHVADHPILTGDRGNSAVSDIRVAARSSRVLSVGNDATLRVWDSRTGRSIWSVQPDPCCGDWGDISPDGRYVAWAACPGVRLYALDD